MVRRDDNSLTSGHCDMMLSLTGHTETALREWTVSQLISSNSLSATCSKNTTPIVIPNYNILINYIVFAVCMCVYMHVCVYMCMYTCVYLCIYMCMCKCVYMYTCVCTRACKCANVCMCLS